MVPIQMYNALHVGRCIQFSVTRLSWSTDHLDRKSIVYCDWWISDICHNRFLTNKDENNNDDMRMLHMIGVTPCYFLGVTPIIPYFPPVGNSNQCYFFYLKGRKWTKNMVLWMELYFFYFLRGGKYDQGHRIEYFRGVKFLSKNGKLRSVYWILIITTKNI